MARMAMVGMMAALALLGGCASPYRQALENPQVERPQPPLTRADLQALEPYDHSRYFGKSGQP